MTDHLREHHPELRFGTTAALGTMLDHYRVTPTDPGDVPPKLRDDTSCLHGRARRSRAQQCQADADQRSATCRHARATHDTGSALTLAARAALWRRAGPPDAGLPSGRCCATPVRPPSGLRLPPPRSLLLPA